MKFTRILRDAMARFLFIILLVGYHEAKSADAPAFLNDLGPENGELIQAEGIWDVTETVWATPGAPPVVTRGLVAERRMVGSILQETLRWQSDRSRTLRVDYLTFNRVEARWEYVSMDTRAAVGIMTAQSYGRGDTNKMQVNFEPFSVPGPGPAVSGQMLRMRQEFIRSDNNHNQKDQYFTMADGIGKEWLAHRYEYKRQR